MAHAMTSPMTVMMALMMIAMAGSALAWGTRKVRAAAGRPVRRRGRPAPTG